MFKTRQITFNEEHSVHLSPVACMNRFHNEGQNEKHILKKARYSLETPDLNKMQIISRIKSILNIN